MTAAFEPSWLAAQRWFRAKQRPIAAISAFDHASLGRADLRVLEVAYVDGGSADHYLVPTVDGREPDDGDGAWTAIVRAMGERAELPGERGSFICSRTDAFEELLPSAQGAIDALGERRLRVEQSNTSVVLGERLILKLYRLLEPGENPDLEVSLFLTEVGFADTPAVAGAMAYAERKRRRGGRGDAPGLRPFDRGRLGRDASPARRRPPPRRRPGCHPGRPDRRDACRARITAGPSGVSRARGDGGRDGRLARVGRAPAGPGGDRRRWSCPTSDWSSSLPQ